MTALYGFVFFSRCLQLLFPRGFLMFFDVFSFSIYTYIYTYIYIYMHIHESHAVCTRVLSFRSSP